MTCEKTTEQLIDWLEGEVPPEVASEIKDHIQGCPACAREVNQIKQALDAVSHPAEDPGEAYFASFYTRLRDHLEQVRIPWSQRLRRWLTRPQVLIQSAATAAALLVAVLTTLMVTGNFHHPQSAGDDLLAEKSANRPNLALIARPRLAAAPNSKQFTTVHADPAIRKAVASLEDDEDIAELQTEVAEVLLGRLASTEVVILPGANLHGPAINTPVFHDLADEDLFEVVSMVDRDVRKWPL